MKPSDAKIAANASVDFTMMLPLNRGLAAIALITAVRKAGIPMCSCLVQALRDAADVYESGFMAAANTRCKNENE